MSVIMHRSFADSMGFNWPKEIAMMVQERGPGIGCSGEYKYITYKELLERRKEEQRVHTESVLRINSPVIKPCVIWAFLNNNNFFFGGWWMYVRTLKQSFPIGFRNQNCEMKLKLMQLFPCGMMPLVGFFDNWIEKFAKEYPHRTTRRKKEGIVYAWALIDGHGNLMEVAKTYGELSQLKQFKSN